jgi:hypothetical protein
MFLGLWGLWIVASWPCVGLALLEETLVTFAGGNETFQIRGAPIVTDQNDFKGVHIAVGSLSADLEEITGIPSTIQFYTANSSWSGNATFAIIVGSTNSSIIQRLSAARIIDMGDVDQWEVFKTRVVHKPLPGIEQALVIAGSDKRGTIFGIHTLSEQCGQSP